MPDVFVNYRTSDARFGAAATYELLVARFGRHRVFLDNQSIPPGTSYVTELSNALESMRVLLVLIGPTWLGTDPADPDQLLLNRRGDWVRREIRRALERQVPIIPVLLDGTSIPDRCLLPKDIQPLVLHQKTEVRHDRLGADVGRLADRLATLIPAEVAPPMPTPQQLPTRLSGFVGRDAEIAHLDRWLRDENSDTPHIVVLCGTPGVGKTTLATDWAHRVRDRFPDGTLYVNLRGFDRHAGLDPTDALHGFLTALGLPPEAIPDALDDRAALFRSSLANRRVLVLLDNARAVDQVRPLLPGTPSCPVLVTTRTRLHSLAVREGARHITLDTLTRSEAHLLLGKRIAHARLTAEPDAAEAIVAWCAGLPLALSLVAALAEQRPGPLAQIMQELGKERTQLDVLVLGDEDLDLRSVFSWSYQRLSAPGRALFRLIGLHPGPDISRDACIALSQTGNARHALDELVRSSLLTEYTPGRYSLHDLLRVYAVEQAHLDTTEPERQSIHRDIADHYLHHVTAAAHWLEPNIANTVATSIAVSIFAGYAEALSWSVAEHSVVLAVIELCAQHGLDSHVWRIASMSNAFLRRTGRRQERVEVHRAAVDAAVHADNRLAWATASRDLASALARLGQYDEACTHLDAALPVLESADDRFGLLQAHMSYTRVLDAQEKYDDALRHARAALSLTDPQHDAVSHADVLIHLGHQLAKLGKYAEALPVCTEALQCYDALQHLEGQSSCLLTIGMIHQGVGDYTAAIVSLERSCTLDRQVGDQYWEGFCLDRLGEVHSLLGQLDVARQRWCEALTILDSLHHPEAARVRSRLNASHHRRQRVHKPGKLTTADG